MADETTADAYLSNDDNSDPYNNAFDTDVKSMIPLWGGLKGTGTGLYSLVTEQDWSDLMAGLNDLGNNAYAFWGDPLNWLVSTGLTFLIDFFQPLEDLLSLITGNAERIESYAGQWKAMGDALIPLAEATRDAANNQLIEWKGLDATAAKARLNEFSDGIEATSGEAASISALLSYFSTLMAAAQGIITGILATLIEWAIISWGVALGLATVSSGSSIALAEVNTVAVQIIDKVIILLFKMAAMIKKLLPATLVAKVGLSVVEFTVRLRESRGRAC